MASRQEPPPGAAPESAAVLAALRSGPFGLALRTAIEARGLPLERLRSRLAERGLRIAVTTLSYWQRGLRRPERPESLRVVAALEEILGLPAHALTALLGAPRPRGGADRDGAGPRPYPQMVRTPGDLGGLLADLDSPAAGKLQVVTEYATVTVGPRRELAALSSMVAVRARQDGVDRALLIYDCDEGVDEGAVEIVAGDSCRLGRVRRDPVARVVLAELLFDRSLHCSETQVFSFEVRPHSAAECCRYRAAFRFPADHYVLRVRFDPGELPVQCQWFTASDSEGPDDSLADLTLDSHHLAHVVATALGPGVAGIRWAWT
ncbi:helix-turn-helix domain-containing protein [Kitasatospora sp. NPDC059811]|uniref:helix-turn-helix domain-containing protein n=1 Tax=Streptomycetaceae TaxID=2062 RepID=UPI0007AF3B78|nr:helix-turn-helix transcriptional regulator [Streptomyces sp. MJM8645]